MVTRAVYIHAWPTRDACDWTDLHNTDVAAKIRLLHGQTHATTRTLLRPEFLRSRLWRISISCFASAGVRGGLECTQQARGGFSR